MSGKSHVPQIQPSGYCPFHTFQLTPDGPHLKAPLNICLLLLQVVTVFTPSPNIDTLSLNFWHQDLVKLRWKGRKSEKKRFH
jgi:hypothetical protein